MYFFIQDDWSKMVEHIQHKRNPPPVFLKWKMNYPLSLTDQKDVDCAALVMAMVKTSVWKLAYEEMKDGKYVGLWHSSFLLLSIMPSHTCIYIFIISFYFIIFQELLVLMPVWLLAMPSECWYGLLSLVISVYLPLIYVIIDVIE